MPFRSLETADLAGKRVLVRVDLNVPMADGAITDDTRLRAVLPTIHYLSTKGARTILLAHFDRPKGKRVPEMSLKPIAEPLSNLLEQPVFFADDSRATGVLADQLALLEETVRDMLNQVRIGAIEELSTHGRFLADKFQTPDAGLTLGGR